MMSMKQIVKVEMDKVITKFDHYMVVVIFSGWSTAILSSKSTVGMPEWMAPGVLHNEPSNEKDPNLRPSFADLTTALKSLQRLVVPLLIRMRKTHLWHKKYQ
ncbi:uncharacterized protein LOC120274993 [Dioscorea cayenensis subsp. rotundata]|uniref:Uncharacterized protein LOC120274993 n=1 Tax=Dioscorea cayennensis subsp. rotundata TaxID=55577 RepID=A0AB40CC59_DIOCR|nr:uncharacterized protein LOC120274993 [Dioscorea cayenensis subsp. rotundata]XP_039137453.1 uncharacterized protein LOC120274993 [Dioscorea cayenensis subsp. rotundata]XP_039137454.1 uncharacterized protein LOC120274993 [Dioscorea cayenensis subsp. rotundata]XP_039137455.1 uncharacterized protein LOC120274993 [Dioscorea cayenensis subsp. rotundata]